MTTQTQAWDDLYSLTQAMTAELQAAIKSSIWSYLEVVTRCSNSLDVVIPNFRHPGNDGTIINIIISDDDSGDITIFPEWFVGETKEKLNSKTFNIQNPKFKMQHLFDCIFELLGTCVSWK